jgi:hypothetical protein
MAVLLTWLCPAVLSFATWLERRPAARPFPRCLAVGSAGLARMVAWQPLEPLSTVVSALSGGDVGASRSSQARAIRTERN